MVLLRQEQSANLEAVQNLREELELAQEELLLTQEELKAAEEDVEELESLMEVEKAGRDAATQDVKASMAKEMEEQVSQLEAEIATLVEASSTLQTKLDEAEMALATANDGGQRQLDDETSKTVQKLVTQLTRSKEEVQERTAETVTLKNALETRVAKAEQDVTRLEKELSATKGKLYEADKRI